MVTMIISIVAIYIHFDGHTWCGAILSCPSLRTCTNHVLCTCSPHTGRITSYGELHSSQHNKFNSIFSSSILHDTQKVSISVSSSIHSSRVPHEFDWYPTSLLIPGVSQSAPVHPSGHTQKGPRHVLLTQVVSQAVGSNDM